MMEVNEMYQRLSKKELHCLKKHVHFGMIVTEDKEWHALIGKIQPMPGYSKIFRYDFSDNFVFGSLFIGVFGKHLIVFAQCQNAGMVGDDLPFIHEMLKMVEPRVVIAVGMLDGLNVQDPIGKVLISTQIIRLERSSQQDRWWVDRGGQVQQTAELLRATFAAYIRDHKVNAEFAQIVSADNLVRLGLEDTHILTVLASFPEARGIEMEGHGFATKLEDALSDASAFLIVKGISQYCIDASEENERLACENAVDLCFLVFDQEDAFNHIVTPPKSFALSADILKEIRGYIGKTTACIVIPSPDTMRRPTLFYTGRAKEDRFLKTSLLDEKKKLIVVFGPRGTGKSEILRHSLLKTKGSRSVPWIQHYFDIVLIVDFAYTRVKQSWIEYIAESAKGLLDQTIVDFIREHRFQELFQWGSHNVTRQIFLVFENCEELINGSDENDPWKEANTHDFTNFIRSFLAAEPKNIKVMILTASESVLAEFDQIQSNPSVDLYHVPPLSPDDAYMLLRDWEKNREDNRYAIDDSRVRDCIYGPSKVSKPFHSLVSLTQYLPRTLRTLNGILAIDAPHTQNRKTIEDMDAHLKQLIRDADSDNLSLFLDSIYQSISDQRRSLLLFMAAIRLAVSPTEVRSALKFLQEHMNAYAFDKRTISKDLAELETLGLIGKLGDINKWELPNQILDFITDSMLEVLPPQEREAYYHTAIEILNARCDDFEAESLTTDIDGEEMDLSGLLQEYRYENDEYCTNVAERIRCYGFVREAEARIITLKEFLGLMSWWGEFEDFKAIDYILEAWTLSRSHREGTVITENGAQPGHEFHRQLMKFYANYVKRPDCDLERDWSAKWRSALSAILSLETILENDKNSLEPNNYRRLLPRLNQAKANLSIFKADALSQLGEVEAATQLYETGIEYLKRVAAFHFDIPFTRVILFSHHAKYGNWTSACQALLPTCDPKKGRDANARAIEARILDAFSDYFFHIGDFENGILAGLYSSFQSYTFLFTQPFLVDSYTLLSDRMFLRRFYNRLNQSLSDSHSDAALTRASVCTQIRAFWQQAADKILLDNDDAHVVAELMIQPIHDYLHFSDSKILPAEMPTDLSQMDFLPLPPKGYHGKVNSNKKLFATAVANLDIEIDDYITQCGELMKRAEGITS